VVNSRVFCIEPPRDGFDVSTAARFGELTPIFKDRDRRCSVFRPDQYRHRVWEVLQEAGYQPAVDYFIMIGAMIPVSLAMTALMEHVPPGTGVKILMFSSHDGEYVERVIGYEPLEV
jgi:hypothetical protein